MQMYVNYYTRELMNPGDNPPVGIVLCAEKNDAVVRYTLPEDENAGLRRPVHDLSSHAGGAANTLAGSVTTTFTGI